jgi:hypothetical protein
MQVSARSASNTSMFDTAWTVREAGACDQAWPVRSRKMRP